jgi:hypothetical protein
VVAADVKLLGFALRDIDVVELVDQSPRVLWLVVCNMGNAS